MSKLEIIDLHVGIDGKEILKGVNLEMNTGEIHAIMDQMGPGNQPFQKPSWVILNMKCFKVKLN